VSTARPYFEAVLGIMIMLMLSVTSGFQAAGVAANRIAVTVTRAVVFLATVAIISLGLIAGVGVAGRVS
jgi:hypothetical protein